MRGTEIFVVNELLTARFLSLHLQSLQTFLAVTNTLDGYSNTLNRVMFFSVLGHVMVESRNAVSLALRRTWMWKKNYPNPCVQRLKKDHQYESAIHSAVQRGELEDGVGYVLKRMSVLVSPARSV